MVGADGSTEHAAVRVKILTVNSKDMELHLLQTVKRNFLPSSSLIICRSHSSAPRSPHLPLRSPHELCTKSPFKKFSQNAQNYSVRAGHVPAAWNCYVVVSTSSRKKYYRTQLSFQVDIFAPASKD